MKIASTILLICIYFVSSCGLIAKTAYRAKKPKIETAESIVHWLNKHEIHWKVIATVEPSSYYSIALFYLQGPMLFNKQGEFVSVGYNYDGKFCPKGVDEFLKSLTPGFEKEDPNLSNYLLYTNSKNIQDTAYPTIKHVLGFSRDLYGRDLSKVYYDEKSDYTLLVPFSIFMGHTIQLNKLKTILSAVNQNGEARINVLLLNFDKQSWWTEEWQNKISIGI